MRTPLALLAALLGSFSVPSFALSGKIVDAYGAGKAGVVVSVDSTTATTDADGAWTIGTTIGVEGRPVQVQAWGGNHVSMVNGRPVLSFHGYDIDGRPLSKGSVSAIPKALASGIAARTSELTLDTFTYSWNGKVFLRDTTSDLNRNGLVANFDTTMNAAILYGWISDTRDGRIYRTVLVGKRNWMAQNLNFEPSGSDSGWWYNNSAVNGAKYGRIYDWASGVGLNSSCNSKVCSTQIASKHNGICPTNWHVPSESEWTSLQNTVDSTNTADGTKLKSINGWNSNGNGTDGYGFRVLPAGQVQAGSFFDAGSYSCFWSASEGYFNGAFSPNFLYSYGNVRSGYKVKSYGCSLRCLMGI